MTAVDDFRTAIATDMANLLAGYSAVLTAAQNIDDARVAAGLGLAHTLAAFAVDRITATPSSAQTIFMARDSLPSASLVTLMRAWQFENVALAAASSTPFSTGERNRFVAALAQTEIPASQVMFSQVTAIPQGQPNHGARIVDGRYV